MATNIGPRIGIEGEDKYRKQIMNLIQQTKTLDSQLKALASTSEKDATAQEKAAKSVKLLTDQQSKQEAKVKLLKKMVAESAKETSENSTQTLKWKQALADAETELNKTNDELDKAKRAADGFGDEVDDSTGSMEQFNEAAVMMARQQIADVLNRAAEAAANFGKKALGSVVKTTMEFDTAMSQVKALSGATGDEFDTLRKKARDMGASTKYSATESAEALNYMALAGWNTEQMVDGLDGVLNLAAASGMELAEASDIVTDFLAAFGKEAKDAGKMADMMAYAQAHSNTTTRQLGEAFRNSAANMNTAGQTMETTTALLEAMANQGNKGSEAGTALAAMMRDLTQKMKGGKIMIGKTAVQVTDANGNFRNMIDILADVEKATEGMGTAEKSAALMTTFTARSVKGVNQVLNEGVPNLYAYEDALRKSSGAAGDMAETMQDNLEGQLTIMKSTLQELAISVGDQLAPAIKKGGEIVQSIIDKFNAMPDGVKKAVAVIMSVGTVAAIVVPKIISFANTIKSLQSASAVIKAMKQMNGQIGETGKSVSGATSSMTGLAKGIGLTTAAVGAGVTALMAINSAIKEWRMKNDEAYASAMKFASAMEEMRDEAESYGDGIADLRDELKAESQMEMTAAERAKSAAQKYSQAQANRANADKKLIIAKNKLIEMLGSEAKAEEAIRKGTINVSSATHGLASAMDGLFGKQTASVESYNDLITTIQKYQGETENADSLIDELTKTLTDNGYTLEEAQALANDFGDAMGDMGDDMDEAADVVEEATGEMKQSFHELWAAAKEDIGATLNIFEKWADDSAKSMDEIATNMIENAKAWANWSGNIETLTNDARYKSDRAFKELVDGLVDMGPAGAKAMDEFAKAVKNGNEDAIKSWTKATESAAITKDKVTNQLATMRAKTELENNKIKQSYKGMADGTKASANNMVSALTGKEPAVKTAMGRINSAVTGNLPKKDLVQAAFSNAGQGAADGLNSKQGAVGTAANNLKNQANKAKPNYNDFYTAGQNIANGLAKGINSKASYVNSVASNVASLTIRTVKSIAQIKSPSRVFEGIGEFMTEGLAIGLSDTRQVERASAALAKAAISPTLSFGADGINGTATSNSFAYGDIVVNVSGANVQNEELLAKKISNEIFRQVKAERMAWA